MLREKYKDYKIILASGSPRRQQFLRDLDIDFEIRLKEVDEIYPEELHGVAIPEYLARLKSTAFDGELNNREMLITSDTIVWHEGKALGKPVDYDDAVAMLKSLSGKTHIVYTAVCFKTISTFDMITAKTEVTLHLISTEEIKYYLDKFAPFDKAGSYGIQDWIGNIGVASINGTYTNVMGLPVDLVYDYLKKHNI
ncbi:MAG: septum formation protein Maf [Bacteroidetes bacterium]|nr:septum formation protein Maf [Bacteroidota bacterium]